MALLLAPLFNTKCILYKHGMDEAQCGFRIGHPVLNWLNSILLYSLKKLVPL